MCNGAKIQSLNKVFVELNWNSGAEGECVSYEHKRFCVKQISDVFLS